MLGRHGTFFGECLFLLDRSLTDPLGLLAPHSEHPVLLTGIVYLATADPVGTGSYPPFLTVVAIAHVAAAAAIYALLFPRSSWLALGVAGLFLFLGAGADNFFCAFQIAFVAPVALGLWAMWLAQYDRWG